MSPVVSPAEIVSAALAAELEAEISWGGGGERTHCWASQWQPCARAMALDLLFPEDSAPPDADGCARMAQGNDFETRWRARLELAGQRASPRFTVEGAQERFRLCHRETGDVVLTGKIDGKIRFEDRTRYPFETKRGKSYERCRTIEDLLAGQWSEKAVYQILVYLLGMGERHGLLILDTGGLPVLIEVDLEEHLDKAEAFWAAAERAVECKAGAPLPDFAENPEWCRSCDHRGRSCAPPWYSGDGPKITAAPDLVAAVEDCLEHKNAADIYRRQWERLKTICRDEELVIIGDYTIAGRPHGRGWKIEIQEAP